MKPLTVYDLCGEDHYVFARMNNDGEITVEVQDENDNVVYREKSNKAAWDSLVAFARMILDQDDVLETYKGKVVIVESKDGINSFINVFDK